MVNILKQYEQDGLQITEYTKDGKTVSHVVKTPIPQETAEPDEPDESEINEEEMNEQTYLNSEYLVSISDLND